MVITRKETRESLEESYGKETVKQVERISARGGQYSFKYLCEFVLEWNRITSKLKKMYGKKLADITFAPTSDVRGEEVEG